MTTRYSYINSLTYVWRSMAGEHRMKTSKVAAEPMDFYGDNFHALLQTLNPAWTREEYLLWCKHWKMLYANISLTIAHTKKWRKTSLILQEKQEVSNARSNELRKLQDLASSLIAIRKTSKILAERAHLTLSNH